MNDSQNYNQDDEIDLRELFATLWEGKVFIIAIAGILTIGGLAYALLAPQEWSAKAIVVEASPVEVEQLRQKLERMVITTTIGNNNNNNNKGQNCIYDLTNRGNAGAYCVYTVCSPTLQ